MSGFSRVSIPDSLRRTIEDIKEIAGQHSDEDIYAMLKDCNMDPNETAQKLLYLDTFHEVKRKRDRRKVRRVTRGGGNQYSPHSSAGGRQQIARQEIYHSTPRGRDSRSSVAVLHKESNKAPAVTGSRSVTNGSASVINGSPIHELNSQIADRNIKGAVKVAKTDCDDISKRLPSLRAVTLKQFENIDPGPTPTSTPTIASTSAATRTPGGSVKPKSSNVGNSVGLYSSATDPVLVPSLNPRNHGSVGIIKRETGNQRNAAEISSSLIDDSRMNGVDNVTFGQVVKGSGDLTGNLQPIESSRLSSSTSNHAAASNGNQENCSAQQDNAPSKVMSEGDNVTAEANLHSLPILEDPIPEQTTSDNDKLHSATKSVIFPNHLHVPETFKNSLMFGSLESSLEQSSLEQNNDSSSKDASIGTDVEVSKERSVMPQASSSMSECSDYPDPPPPPPHTPVNLKPSQGNDASSLRYERSKQEILQPVGGSHNPPPPPSTSDYGLNLIPPTVQLEGLEIQGGNSVVPSSSTSSVTQPQSRGIAQSSISVSPQMFPFIRQTYPPNYIPYNPYFSHLYMPPQHTHQLLSHTGFPHQPSAGNMYIPPPTAAPAASGVKFPVPPAYKPGNIAGNMNHYGITSGYGSYGTSGLAYGSGGTLPPRTSSNDDIAGPELKDKNNYSAIRQNEDLHALHDPSNLQTNVMYNVPQGQAMAFQAGHNSYAGTYHHPSQTMQTRSIVQSQPPMEPTVPPHASYSQPQPQLIPLPQQYGHMNWNQKFLNRENV